MQCSESLAVAQNVILQPQEQLQGANLLRLTNLELVQGDLFIFVRILWSTIYLFLE